MSDVDCEGDLDSSDQPSPMVSSEAGHSFVPICCVVPLISETTSTPMRVEDVALVTKPCSERQSLSCELRA